MRKTVFLFLLVTLLCSLAYAKTESGKAEINLSTGKKKSVQFPHKTHQTKLQNCSLCHDMFPMEENSIKNMIDKGDVKKKTIMNNCKACHKKMKKAGETTGPTGCSGCHTG